MLSDSKETIKSRMIRNASGLWGYNNTQDINSFDPIVGMLMGSLSEELNEISIEIKKTDSRILEKLHELLFHQIEFTHFPAHAIIKARPTQAHLKISDAWQFGYIRRIPKTTENDKQNENKNIYFTPSSSFHLFKGDVKFLLSANQLFAVNEQSKEVLAISSSGVPPDYSKLFIGLKLDNLIEKLDGLSFMFGAKNSHLEKNLYHLLSGSTWKINGKEIVFTQGFAPEPNDSENTLQQIIRKESDISYNACHFVNEFYKERFMTVGNGNYQIKNLGESNLNEYLEELFPAHVLKNIPNGILWIELLFAQPISKETINEMTVSMNCFPVLNRGLNEFTQTLYSGTNVIPLSTPDLFFDIKKISDSKGKVYKPLNSFNSDSDNVNAYFLRQSGIARFDSMDAKETISHLLNLLRDEKGGFSALGTDIIASELKQLDQLVSRLEQRLQSSNIKNEAGYYVLIQSKEGFERANIQFWTISGEMANNIRPDSHLFLHQGNEIESNSIVFITNSTGGKQKLKGEEKMNKLRRMLLSKGRIVTPEDIKALCFDMFGSDLQSVEISRGIIPESSPIKGLSRSVDIHLNFKKQSGFTDEDIEQRSDELKIRLKNESVNLLPYRIIVRRL